MKKNVILIVTISIIGLGLLIASGVVALKALGIIDFNVVDEPIDIEEISNINWEDGSEILYLDSNGEFSYYDDSGSPVDDFDLCSRYDYNENKSQIRLKCFIGYFGPKKLTIKDFDGDTLTIKVGNEERTFEKGQTYYDNEDFAFFGNWKREVDGGIEYISFDKWGSYTHHFEKLNATKEDFRKYCEKYENQNYCNLFPEEFNEGDSFIYWIDFEYDLEYYTYDKKTEIIETFKSDSKEIFIEYKVINVTDEILEVERNGEIIKFEKHYYEEE